MDNSQLQLKNQICFPIYSASKLVTKAYAPYLNELGITYPQYLVLLVLWEQDKITVNDISEKLFLKTNTLSPLLQRMEKLELINRSRSYKDERKVLIKLTTKGKNLKKDALTIPENLIKTILSEKLSLDDLLQLRETLNVLVKTLLK